MLLNDTFTWWALIFLSANLLGVDSNNLQVSTAYGANSIMLAGYMTTLPHLSAVRGIIWLATTAYTVRSALEVKQIYIDIYDLIDWLINQSPVDTSMNFVIILHKPLCHGNVLRMTAFCKGKRGCHYTRNIIWEFRFWRNGWYPLELTIATSWHAFPLR